MVMQERRLHFAGGSRFMAVALRTHLAVQSNPHLSLVFFC